MKVMRTMADLKNDPRISEVNDERRDGMGLWAYANDRDGYFIEGGSDTGSYVQIHEDSLREVLKQANRIKHFSEFSESEKENLRRWAESNRYNLKENPVKGIYTTYKSWLAAAKKAGAVRLDGDEDIAMAFDKNGRGVAEWDGAEGYIYKVKSMIDGSLTFKNPRDVRASSKKEEYNDFDEWQRDAFAAGATQIVKIGEDAFSALRTKDGSMLELDEEGYFDPRSRSAIKGRKNRINIGAWYMDSGTIYRHIIKNHPEFFAYENPVRPRKGESSRAFVSRCMSEEKMSFPEPKQRIAVCLSKSRKRNPVYDTGSDE